MLTMQVKYVSIWYKVTSVVHIIKTEWNSFPFRLQNLWFHMAKGHLSHWGIMDIYAYVLHAAQSYFDKIIYLFKQFAKDSQQTFKQSR